jgi:hypothetical protein
MGAPGPNFGTWEGTNPSYRIMLSETWYPESLIRVIKAAVILSEPGPERFSGRGW